jgi:hypothetical protein
MKFLPVIIAFFIFWDLFWKGKGLWRSAKLSQKYWFIAILLINTLGILPIIYLAFFQKKAKKVARE